MQINQNGNALVGIAPDARKGKLTSTKRTLSSTAGTVLSLDVPAWAQGFELFTSADGVRFAVGEDPAAESTGPDDFAAGAPLWPGQVVGRLIEDGAGRTLRLRGATGSEVVSVAFF